MEIRNSGFILISKLIFISITMAVASLAGARIKAQDAYFKSNASSIVPAAVLCCDDDGLLSEEFGKSFCNNKVDYNNYPDPNFIGSIKITKNCNQKTGEFQFIVTPVSGNGSSLSRAVCSESGCQYE